MANDSDFLSVETKSLASDDTTGKEANGKKQDEPTMTHVSAPTDRPFNVTIKDGKILCIPSAEEA